jgi:ABC-type lipoprotein release transport system permease subunit
MILVLAWRNIWRNKRRSIITLSSIGFSVVFATLLMSIQYGSFEKLIDNSVKFYIGHFQIQSPAFWSEKNLNNSMPYTDDLIHELDKINGIKAVSPRIESFALAANGTITKATMLLGVEPQREEQIIGLKSKLKIGELINCTSKGVLIAEGLADYLKIGLKDTLVLIGQGYHGANAAGLFVIEGILKFPNPMQNKRLIVMSLKKAQWFYNMENRLSTISILLDDYKLMPTANNSITLLLDNEDQLLIDWETMMPELLQLARLKYASTDIMTFILYMVIGFGMFGTFLMMTAERTREFGIMLAIGMKRRLLQLITFIEIFMLSALGVFSGLLLSIILLIYFHYNPIELSSNLNDVAEAYGIEMVIDFSVKSFIFYTQVLAIVLIALILSFYPLFIINRIKPVVAIREG